MSLFSNFTIKEATTVGHKMSVICKSNYNYENQLTIGKEYEVTIIPAILSMSPLCEFIGDNGKLSACHVERFEKRGA